MRFQYGAGQPCDMHKYKLCASYCVCLLHPKICVSNVSMRHVLELSLIDVYFGFVSLPIIILCHHLMRKGIHKILSYVHAYFLRIWFGVVGTYFSLCVFIWGFIYRFLTFFPMPMFQILWHYNFINFGSDQGIVLVSHVICTNTNHVYLTWLTISIPGLRVFNVSMRYFLDLVLCIIFIDFLLNKLLLK
jgi:hypothetical protein